MVNERCLLCKAVPDTIHYKVWCIRCRADSLPDLVREAWRASPKAAVFNSAFGSHPAELLKQLASEGSVVVVFGDGGGAQHIDELDEVKGRHLS